MYVTVMPMTKCYSNDTNVILIC